jgi:hypothetical protein
MTVFSIRTTGELVYFVALVAAMVACGILLAACGGNKQQKLAGKNYGKEQLSQQQALSQQLKETPVEYPKFSDERANINERNVRLNDPNKITYIYLLSRAGTVVMHDTAKGKVSACSSQILPEEGPVRYRGDDLVVPQPEPDGSFGTNGSCIFWFTPQGAYREWDGDYLMSDQPITVTNPVNLVVNAKAKITASVHAKTGNDGAPYGKTTGP